MAIVVELAEFGTVTDNVGSFLVVVVVIWFMLAKAGSVGRVRFTRLETKDGHCPLRRWRSWEERRMRRKASERVGGAKLRASLAVTADEMRGSLS